MATKKIPNDKIPNLIATLESRFTPFTYITTYCLISDWWTVSFYGQEAMSCCGAYEVHGFSIMKDSQHIKEDLKDFEWDAIKKWLEEFLPCGGYHTFALTVVYDSGHIYDRVMDTLYRFIESKGQVISEFENPNTGNTLRLVQFTPPKEEDGDT